jgi:hypothetical protein
MKWYLSWSRDPVIIGATTGGVEWDWMRTFLYLEAFFQVPSHIIGAWGLWRSELRCNKYRLYCV